MSLDKLTQRAGSVLRSLPRKKRIPIIDLISAIRTAGGMGNILLQEIPSISLPKIKTVNIDALIKEAYFQAVKMEHPYVGTEHLLLALLKFIKFREINKIRLNLMKVNLFPTAIKIFDASKKTPIVEQFTQNISQKVLRDLDKELVPRKEYDQLISSLILKDSTGVLLVGDKGVGRKTLIEQLARNTVSLNVPPLLLGYRVIELDLLSFMTNLFNKGGIETGIFTLIDELRTLGRIFLVLKNFENMFMATPNGLTVPMVYSIFKVGMEEAGIKILGVIDSSLYEKVSVDNEHIFSGFSVIEVEEPSDKETLKIISDMAKNLGEYHNVTIPADVVKYAYKRAKEDLPEAKFPKKGVELLDSACSQLILRKSKIPQSYKDLVDDNLTALTKMDTAIEKGDFEAALRSRDSLKSIEQNLEEREEEIFFGTKTYTLTKSDIDKSLETIQTQETEAKKVDITRLSSLANKIKQGIIGQDEAVDTVVKALIRARLGLRTRKRPLGNFLFLGPTGVGKTELAKVLAQNFFGNENLIRLDMSDFSEKHNVARLVGAPPGYVGYGEGGELTTKILAHPNSVVLFDEIEKAHPDVLNILLQITEEGELKDGKGQTFDFSQAVVVLTSNLGTEILHNIEIGFESVSFSDKQVEGRLKGNLKKILKAELLNRMDDVIVFRRLNQEDQYKVLDLLIQDVKEALKAQNIKLTVDTPVKEVLLKDGYSVEYGARALRRTVETKLLDPIAEYLLDKKKKPKSIKAVISSEQIKITI